MIRLILIFCFITISTFGQDNCIYFEHSNSIRVNRETKISLCRISDSIFLTKVHNNDSIRVDLSLKEYKLLEKKIKKINAFSILEVPNNFLDGSNTKISYGWFFNSFEINIYCLKENWEDKKLKPVVEFVELLLKYSGLKIEDLI